MPVQPGNGQAKASMSSASSLKSELGLIWAGANCASADGFGAGISLVDRTVDSDFACTSSDSARSDNIVKCTVDIVCTMYHSTLCNTQHCCSMNGAVVL